MLQANPTPFQPVDLSDLDDFQWSVHWDMNSDKCLAFLEIGLVRYLEGNPPGIHLSVLVSVLRWGLCSVALNAPREGVSPLDFPKASECQLGSQSVGFLAGWYLWSSLWEFHRDYPYVLMV